MRRIALLLALAATGAEAAEWSITYALTPDASTSRASSPYAVPATRAGDGWRQDIGLRVAEGGAVGQFTLRAGARTGEALGSRLDVNQLYVDHAVPRAEGGSWGLTVGKKILASSIGFGFRPLDVIQRENRRAFNAPPLSGVPLAALDRLEADRQIGVVLSGRPDRDPAQGWQPGRQREALTGRAVAYAETYELHGVAQAVAGRGAALGLGAAGTPPAAGELAGGWDTAWHAAALWQRRAPGLRHTLADDPAAPVLASADPLRREERGGVWQTVLGIQFNHGGGWGLLLEYWHDGSAWRAADWRRLASLSQRQTALRGLAPAAAIDGNLAWSANAFRGASLLQDNLLARLSYTAATWNAAAEWLVTPEDGGHVASFSVSREGNRQKIRLGWQRLLGPADSAYGAAPTRDTVFAQWVWAL